MSRGIKWAVAGRLLSLTLQGTASIILGRMLLPADFGLVNFSGIITGFVARFNDMGIESAVLQRPTLESRTLGTAFSAKLAMSVVMLVLLWVLAAPLATLLGSPQAVPVVRVMSLAFLFSAFSFLPLVRLRKSLRYDAIARIWVISTLAGAGCSILLALGGAGYWSIAVGQLVASLINLVVAQSLQPSWVPLGLDRTECRRLLTFGGQVFLSGLLAFACFNLDSFLIGSKLGAVALGVYGIAFNWATQLCSFVSGTVLNVLFPAFANLGGDRRRVRELYLDSVRHVGLAGALGYGAFVLVAPEFLILILGRGTDKWIAALPVLQILCVYGILRLLLEPLANALLALGRADLLFRSGLMVFVVELVGIGAALALGGGTVVVAWVVLIAYALQYFYYFAYVPLELEVPAWRILRLMVPAFGSVVVLTVVSALWPWAPSWFGLFTKGLLGLFAASGLYICLGGRNDFHLASQRVRAVLARFVSDNLNRA